MLPGATRKHDFSMGKTTQSVHCTITGPCLHMHHRPSLNKLHVQCTDSVIMPQYVGNVRTANWRTSTVRTVRELVLDLSKIYDVIREWTLSFPGILGARERQ